MSETEEQPKTVHLTELGQVALTVTDLGRAKAFYKDVLGMSLLYDAGTMAFFACGTVRLMLGLPEKEEPRGGSILYFRVADLDADCETLKQAGVVLTQEPHVVAKMPDYELRMAFFKDPDENVLGLMSEAH